MGKRDEKVTDARLAAIGHFAKGCRTIAAQMRAAAGPADGFRSLATGVGELAAQLRKLDPAAGGMLLEEMACQGLRVAAGIERLAAASDAAAGVAAVLAADLDGLSAVITEIGTSVVPSGHANPPDSRSVAWADEVRGGMGRTAFHLFAMAVSIRDAFGLTGDSSVHFTLPDDETCACGSLAEPQKDARSPEKESCEQPPILATAQPTSKGRIEAMAGLGDDMVDMLDGTADGLDELHRGLRVGWGWPCEDQCTCAAAPTLIKVRIAGVGAAPAGGGAFQPEVTIKWRYCCTVSCLIVYNRCVIKSTTTGPHNVGNPVNGRQNALNIAGRLTVAQLLRYPRPAKPC